MSTKADEALAAVPAQDDRAGGKKASKRKQDSTTDTQDLVDWSRWSRLNLPEFIVPKVTRDSMKIRPMQFFLKFSAEPGNQAEKREAFKKLDETARDQLREISNVYNALVRDQNNKKTKH